MHFSCRFQFVSKLIWKKRKGIQKTINGFYWRWSRRQDNLPDCIEFAATKLLVARQCIRNARLARQRINCVSAALQFGVYLFSVCFDAWMCMLWSLLCRSIVAMHLINFRFVSHSFRLTAIKCTAQTRMWRKKTGEMESNLCERKQIAVVSYLLLLPWARGQADLIKYFISRGLRGIRVWVWNVSFVFKSKWNET